MSGRSDSVIQIEAGRIRGQRSADGAVHSFKGIPYAAAPVGPLRWRPPQAAQSWDGVRDASRFGARCIQHDRPANSVSYFGPEEQSEDCLFVNVWTPAPDHAARCPVIVWFHGGGFSVGSGALSIFDGEAFARRGVVVVTLNHRLGGLGYLAHSQLSQEAPEGVSGNYGLLDQIAALQWVQENIGAFGGDRDHVTIMGQSVGASCVNVIMTSPLARGLFHRAIGQSGGSLVPVGRPGGGSMLTLRQAEEVGAGIVTELGAASVEDLRSRPASDVQLLWPAKPSCRPFMVVDGWVVPEPVHDSFAAGRQHDVPLLTGANSDEASARLPLASLDGWVRALKDEFGDQWKRLFDAYGAGENFGEMSRRLACHKGFNWVNWTWARLHQRSRGADVFFYHFSHAPPLPQDHYAEGRADALGAFHTAEIPYVFGTLDKRDWRATAHDNDLSRIMSSYWVNFAMRGDPNGPGLPHWPQFDAHAPSIMRFNDDVAAGSLPERALMDLWDDCMARLRE